MISTQQWRASPEPAVWRVALAVAWACGSARRRLKRVPGVPGALRSCLPAKSEEEWIRFFKMHGKISIMYVNAEALEAVPSSRCGTAPAIQQRSACTIRLQLRYTMSAGRSHDVAPVSLL